MAYAPETIRPQFPLLRQAPRHNPFSARSRGRNFSLFSRVVAAGLFTSKLAQDPKSVLSGPIFFGPVDFGWFGGEVFTIVLIEYSQQRQVWIPTETPGCESI